MKRKWDKEIIKKIALNYKTRCEFKNNDPKAYDSARKHKWLDEICTHMVSGKLFWTKEKIINVAKKYKSMNDFKKYDIVVYKRASFKKLLDEINLIYGDTLNYGNKYKRLVYVYEFIDNHAYVGLTFNERIRDSQHHISGPVYEHMKKTNLIPNKKILSHGYISVNDAMELEKNMIDKYKENGWVVLNKRKGGQISGGKPTKYENEQLKMKCHEESLKYRYRNDFKKNSPSIYEKVRRHKWLNELCSHMEYKYKKKEKV